MPCHTRMKTILMQGVLWLCLLNFGFVICVIEPGYLDFDNLPDTNFSCVGKVIGGYYADLETSCQMFHVCTIGQLDEPMDIRFLCLNGTVFDQETRVCERVDEVDCTKSERFYHLNLELYGNTAPPIVEESGNTEPPIISSTTTTTTPRSTSSARTTRATFFTTPAPTKPPTTHSTPKVITSNQFPIHGGPDIRFNPEEINIRLTPGSPPIIKSPSVSFQQHNFNGDARITVTTHTSVYKDDRTSQKTATTQKPKSVVNYGLQHTSNKQSYIPHSFDYSYQNTENSDLDYHTDLPSGEYSDLGYDGHMDFESTNQKKHIVYTPSTTKRIENKPYVSSTGYPSSVKPPHGYYHRTEKPPNLQLPLPVFPTLPPLTFSSPAPFSLNRHIETKRSNDQRPRIIVSASASVSDASGRRLNYSLGTIGQHILGKAPHSYDEYKEGDVGLDPFYHDVPKVGGKPRKKRNVEEEENSAKEETSMEQTTHWIPPDYVDDNYEPLTYNNTEKNITVDDTTKTTIDNETKPTENEYEYYYEYIDDNYEPSVYDGVENKTTDIEKILTTTESSTLPSTIAIQETTIESNSITESLHEYQKDTTEIPATTTVVDEKEDITTTNNYQELEESTTFEPEKIKTTTIVPETTTISKIEHLIDQIQGESIESFDTITTTETSTMSIDSLQEHTITTPATVTESIYYVTNSYESTTAQEETTTNIVVSVPEPTTDLQVETTTGIGNHETTGIYETTLNLDNNQFYNSETTKSNMEETITELKEEETTTAIPTTEESLKETTTDVPSTTDISPTTDIPSTTTDIPSTTTDIPSTTTVSTTTNRYQYLRTRDPAYKRYSRTKPTSRHRFSSPTIHMSQSLLKLRGNKLSNPSTTFSSSEEIASEVISHRLNKIIPESKLFSTTSIVSDDVPVTDAPLSKSANPTEPKNSKSPLSTTPIAKTTFFIPRRFTYDVKKSFNCFGKELNKFYEDPRDCRLFHYCTPGYTETQVLDMKFVCDYGTYFDSDKLICTKIKPQRCK